MCIVSTYCVNEKKTSWRTLTSIPRKKFTIKPLECILLFLAASLLSNWHELAQPLRTLPRKFCVVSSLVSLSSMWSFVRLVDSSVAIQSFAAVTRPHLVPWPLPWNIVARCTKHVSPPGGLEWHRDHNGRRPPDSAAVRNKSPGKVLIGLLGNGKSFSPFPWDVLH